VEGTSKPEVPREAGGSRLRMWLRIAAVLVVVLGAVVGGGWLVLRAKYAFRPEEGWIDDQRLKMPPYERPVVEVNGFDSYMEASELCERIVAAVPRPSSPYPRGSSFRPSDPLTDYCNGNITLEEVWPYVDSMGPVLGKLHLAADLSYVPPDPYSAQGTFATHSKLRELARMLMGCAQVMHDLGDDRRALERVRDGLALAVNVPQRDSLVRMLVGVACASIMQDTALPVIVEGRLPADEYLAHADYIRALRERVCPYGDLLAMETRAMGGHLDRLASQGIEAIAAYAATKVGGRRAELSDLAWRKRVQCLVFAKTADVEDMRIWAEDRFARIGAKAQGAPWDTEMDKLTDQATAHLEARNDLLTADWIPAGVYNKWLQQHAILSGQETAACLAAFRAMHGSYPVTLEELVPEIMPELPPDPFTGDPLEYRRKGDDYVLYSVGPDKKDHGGSRTRAKGTGYYQEDMVFLPPKPRPTPAPSPPPGMGMGMGYSPGLVGDISTE